MKNIVVLTNSHDVHADNVIKQVPIFRFCVIRLDSDKYGENHTISFDPNKGYTIHWQNRRIKETDIHSIWYRKPSSSISTKDSKIKNQFKKISRLYQASEVYETYKQFMFGILNCNILVVSHLRNLFEADHKLNQIRVAKEIGFQIPDSLLSSDVDEIKAFYNKHKSLITKPLVANSYEYKQQTITFPTRKFSSDELDNFLTKRIRYPVYLQKYIDKKSDLRVIVIGKKVIAFEMHTQENEKTKVDSRMGDFYQIAHNLYDLDNNTKNLCIELTNKLGVNFGAIDFALSKKGTPYFLEINAGGQYLWLEKITKYPLSQEIAHFLMKGK